MSLYLLFKTMHILFMVSWFAGIFYLPRLFVYHAESNNQETKDQLAIMENRLIKFITPIGLLAIFFGLIMGFLGSNWVAFFSQGWIITKLFVVSALILYQVLCLKVHRDLGSNKHNWTGFKLHIFNEVPVLLLLIGIIAAVFKFWKPTFSIKYLREIWYNSALSASLYLLKIITKYLWKEKIQNHFLRRLNHLCQEV